MKTTNICNKRNKEQTFFGNWTFFNEAVGKAMRSMEQRTNLCDK